MVQRRIAVQFRMAKLVHRLHIVLPVCCGFPPQFNFFIDSRKCCPNDYITFRRRKSLSECGLCGRREASVAFDFSQNSMNWPSTLIVCAKRMPKQLPTTFGLFHFSTWPSAECVCVLHCGQQCEWSWASAWHGTVTLIKLRIRMKTAWFPQKKYYQISSYDFLAFIEPISCHTNRVTVCENLRFSGRINWILWSELITCYCVDKGCRWHIQFLSRCLSSHKCGASVGSVSPVTVELRHHFACKMIVSQIEIHKYTWNEVE